MKVELNAQEKKQLDTAVANNPVHKWMKNQEVIKFEIGDVLCKYTLRTDYQTKKQSWVVENINSDNKMAQRYVYIYEDEFGIGYMKQLRVANGTLGKELYCMTDVDFGHTKFEVDPEYAEHTLLDADFDIKKIHKASLAARKIVTKMNRKVGVKPKTLKEFNQIFDKLNIGDTFWTTSDYTGRYIQEYTITAKTQHSVSSFDIARDWDWRRYKDKDSGKRVDDTTSYKISYTGSYPRDNRQIVELDGYVIYTTQKPAQEEKNGS